MPTGALLVDKPPGPTSHDVVARVRRLAREKRCGHTGTLDPFATGLLILLLGRATRLARFLSEFSKTYVADVRFGFATDTYDRTGKPQGPVVRTFPESSELEEVLEGFLGAREQQPPPFSAKKIGGKRAHRMARAGLAVAPAPVRVRIEALKLLAYEPPIARLEARVSSGTYVRSLAHDLGRELGVGAHLDALRRTRIGSFCVDAALGLEAVSELADADRLGEKILPPLEALRDLESVTLDAENARRLVHGRPVPWSDVTDAAPPSDVPFRVPGPDGAFLAVGGPGSREAQLETVLVWGLPSGR